MCDCNFLHVWIWSWRQENVCLLIIVVKAYRRICFAAGERGQGGPQNQHEYFMWKGPSKEYCCERVPKKWCCESALRHGAVKAPEKCCCESAKNGAEKAPMVLWKRQKWCCESAKACAMKAQMVLWKRCRCCISTQKGCCESAAGAAEGPAAEP